MRFILRMAWRDTRFARRRLLLYSCTVILGIGALVGVGSLGANLRRTISDQPKRLLGADLRVGLDRWPNPDLERFMQGLGARGSAIKLFPDKLSFQGAPVPQRVQVVAIDGAYPFYGEFSSEPASGVERLRRGERVVLVDEHLAERMHLKVGSAVTVGSGSYTVAGVVREFPGDSSFSLLLQSRAYLPWSTLPSGTTQAKSAPGNYRIYYQLPAGTDAGAVATEIKSRITSGFLVIVTAADLAKRIEKALTAGDRFFSLILFVTLFLGGIGIASTLHIFIHERLRTVAILRCMGASSPASFAIYLCQAAALGACGAAGGVAIGIVLQLLGPSLLKDFLPFHVEFFFAGKAMAAGALTGFLLCLVFALLPLLAVRRVPPLAALRFEAAEKARPDPLGFAVWGLIAASIFGFAWLQTRNAKVAAAYFVSLAVVFGIFAGAARLLSMVARHALPRRAPYPVRQGIANLYRPRNRTTLLLLSLGFGLFLVLTVYLARDTLLQDLNGENLPNLVFSEVDETALNPILGILKAQGARVMSAVPSIQVSLQSVNGKPWLPEKDSGSGPGLRFRFPAKLQATYRPALAPYETVIAGSFVGRAPAGAPIIPISVVQWMVRPRMPLHLGDEADWLVEGVPIRTRIASVRETANTGFRLDPVFPIVFPLGSVDAAPHKTLILARARTPADSAAIQRAAGAYPNVRVFDIAQLLQTFQRVLAKVALVIDFIALFTIGTGLVILGATIITGRHQRARESVLLRTLGATRGQLRWVQLTEYAVLGILSAILGGGLATAGNHLLARFVLHMPAAGGIWDLSIAAALAVAVAVATGVFADRGIANLPPLEILREET